MNPHTFRLVAAAGALALGLSATVSACSSEDVDAAKQRASDAANEQVDNAKAKAEEKAREVADRAEEEARTAAERALVDSLNGGQEFNVNDISENQITMALNYAGVENAEQVAADIKANGPYTGEEGKEKLLAEMEALGVSEENQQLLLTILKFE